MRKILILILVFSIGLLSAQNSESNVDANGNFTQLQMMHDNNGVAAGGISFNNPQKEVKGSVYLFDNWKNYCEIHLKDTKQKYLIRNININIQRNTFESQIAQDSIYTFNPNSIDKFIINNVTYKNIYSDEGKRIYMVIYESDEFTILEGYSVSLSTGSPNPMINRSNDRFVRNSSYYVKTKNSVSPFKLRKSKVMDLLSDNPEKAAKVEKFISDNNLSYKKTSDLKMALQYSDI